MADYHEKQVRNNIYGLGDANIAYVKYFKGRSYLNDLVAPDDNVDISVSNISFEPGCRNNWHIHRGYQVLICTAGEGWFQEEGRPVQLMKPGDVVVVHEGIKHWHGATKNSWFAHLVITKGMTKWYDAVDDDYYNSLKN